MKNNESNETKYVIHYDDFRRDLTEEVALACHHELWMGIADWCEDIEYFDIDSETVRGMYMTLKRSLVAGICVKYNIKTKPGLNLTNSCFLCELCGCACGLCPLNYEGTTDCLDGLYDKFCNELNDCTLGCAAQVARAIANKKPKARSKSVTEYHMDNGDII